MGRGQQALFGVALAAMREAPGWAASQPGFLLAQFQTVTDLESVVQRGETAQYGQGIVYFYMPVARARQLSGPGGMYSDAIGMLTRERSRNPDLEVVVIQVGTLQRRLGGRAGGRAGRRAGGRAAGRAGGREHRLP